MNGPAADQRGRHRTLHLRADDLLGVDLDDPRKHVGHRRFLIGARGDTVRTAVRGGPGQLVETEIAILDAREDFVDVAPKGSSDRVRDAAVEGVQAGVTKKALRASLQRGPQQLGHVGKNRFLSTITYSRCCKV